MNTLFFLYLGRNRSPEKGGFHLSQCLQTSKFSPRDLTVASQCSIEGKCFSSSRVPTSNSMPSRNTSQTINKETHKNIYTLLQHRLQYSLKKYSSHSFQITFIFFSCYYHEIAIHINFSCSLVSLPILLNCTWLQTLGIFH